MDEEPNEQCEGCETEVGDEPFYCHTCETGVFCAGCWDGCECQEQIDDRLMLKQVEEYSLTQTDGKVIGRILFFHMNIPKQGAELWTTRPEYLGER